MSQKNYVGLPTLSSHCTSPLTPRKSVAQQPLTPSVLSLIFVCVTRYFIEELGKKIDYPLVVLVQVQ